ncbi:MAG: GNAT family N-acetyltransferase [Thermoleophilia bacterium]|nr:GNAT family N-acetyltransferase [Thermoleophilia bacterium]
MARLVEPTIEQILDFCAANPVERVFLEDAARRRMGRFRAVERRRRLVALCHLGANTVPSGEGCDAFAGAVAGGRTRMLIGEEGAVTDLWEAARIRLPRPRDDRPGQPVFVIEDPPEPGETGLRPATLEDLDRLVPASAAAHEGELGVDPLMRDAEAFRWRTRTQIEEGRSWVWLEDGAILFKAEASAWTPRAVQIQQVWVDPEVRSRGYATRGMRDLCRFLLERVPTVCLFVRTDNEAAIRVYEAIGMRRALTYRSVLF